MYQRLRQMVVWAVAFAMIVAITAIDGGPASAAPYTTQVVLGAARPFAVLATAAVTANAGTVINGNLGWGGVLTPSWNAERNEHRPASQLAAGTSCHDRRI